VTGEDAPIVVALGGSTNEDGALLFAAEAAQRTGRRIRVVHVAHGFVPFAPHNLSVSYETAGEIGLEVVRRGAERLRKLTNDEVETSTVVARGNVVEQLLAISRDADLLVLSHRDRSGPQRVFTGSVSGAVAGRSAVDTVSVPGRWAPTSSFISRVVVGVGTWRGADPLLERAFDLADRHHASLRVLHTFYLPAVYEDANGEAEEAFEQSHRATTQLIEDALDPVQRRHEGVDCTVDLQIGRPADALVEAAQDADLLVVGRRDTAHPAVEHLGSVTRALLRLSSCPVDVVPRPLA
jgi:nucleotide-binding universal stress UspA family protein